MFIVRKNIEPYKLFNLRKKALLAHKDGGQNGPVPKQSSIKMAQFQISPTAETAHFYVTIQK